MKRTKPLYHTAALLLLMLAAACTRDDTFNDPAAIGNAARALTITVSDGAYTSALPEADVDTPAAAHAATHDATPTTRTVEEGSATRFTANDYIGLYVGKARTGADGHPEGDIELLHRNLRLTYDGTEWKPPFDTELKYDPDKGYDLFYFAYYPYQEDMSYREPDGQDENGAPAATAPDFFHKLIRDWTPKNDQSTYADYTASDLMVARGEITPCPDNTSGSLLSFKMQHQMMLYIVRFPGTTCTYTETIDEEEKQQSYKLYTGASFGENGFWMENPLTARRIDSPTKMPATNHGYSYYDSQLTVRRGSLKISSVSESYRGKCRTITITDQSMPATKERTLQEGDFYMKDGSILPADACGDKEMPQEVKKDCIGVVFWVGEKEGMHWTKQTGYKEGDHLLTHDHPTCTHGMVAALQNASESPVAWATNPLDGKSLREWAKDFASSGFTDKEKSIWELVSASDSFYGYSKNACFGLYTAHNTDAVFPAYEAVKTYAGSHPTPEGCSGWFFPGKYELATMWFGAPTKFGIDSYEYYYEKLAMHKIINPQIIKAGGAELSKVEGQKYWSCYDNDDKTAWYIWFKAGQNPDFSNLSQEEKCDVRAVLAF